MTACSGLLSICQSLLPHGVGSNPICGRKFDCIWEVMVNLIRAVNQVKPAEDTFIVFMMCKCAKGCDRLWLKLQFIMLLKLRPHCGYTVCDTMGIPWFLRSVNTPIPSQTIYAIVIILPWRSGLVHAMNNGKRPEIRFPINAKLALLDRIHIKKCDNFLVPRVTRAFSGYLKVHMDPLIFSIAQTRIWTPYMCSQC